MKRHTLLVPFLIVSFIIFTREAHPQVTISASGIPSSFSIPVGTATIQDISYTFTTVPAADITLQSLQGTFLAGNTIIGSVNVPLSASIKSGSGRTTELVNIPVSVTRRAKSLGATKITYGRIFSDGNDFVQVQADITVTTEAGAKFSVKRLQLYFDNRRAEITVKRNTPKVNAYADIRYTGSGLLEGFWEVDGRLLHHVKRHIVFGGTVTLKAPDIPPIPTFDSGTHRLRFVLIRPDGAIPLPEAIYFVTEDTFRPKASPLSLISPRPSAAVDYAPTTFQWEGRDGSVLCLIEFLEEGEEAPIYSTYRRSAEYTLSSAVLTSVFSPGKSYLWRVKGFDSLNNIAGESKLSRFRFREGTSK
jgi:hypothetical protein